MESLEELLKLSTELLEKIPSFGGAEAGIFTHNLFSNLTALPQTGSGSTRDAASFPVFLDTIVDTPSVAPTVSDQKNSSLTLPIPVTVDLRAGSDTGISSTDNITSDNTPTFAVDTLTGLRIRLYSDGQLVGQTSLTKPKQVTATPITDGPHTFTATAMFLGIPLATSAPLQVTIDTVLPQLNISTPLSDAPLTPTTRLSGTASGTGTTLTSLTYRFDNATEIPVTVSSSSFDTALNFTDISDGTHTLRVTAKDAAGNVTTTTFNVTVELDTTPPLIVAELANDTGSDLTDNITNDPTIAGTISDTSPIASFRAGFDDTPSSEFAELSASLDSSGGFSFDRTQLEEINANPLSDGDHVLHLTATDTKDNSADIFNVPFTLDTTVPSLSINTPIAGGMHSSTARLTGSTMDAGVGIDLAQYKLDAGTPKLLETNPEFDTALSDSGLSLGNRSVVITSIDSAGNQTEQSINFQVTDNFFVGGVGTTGWGATSADTVLLGERDSSLVQATMPVTLGQASGSRTLKFDLTAKFDTTDTQPAIEDLFQVYLVSATNPNQTLLDGGKPGTALFSASGDVAEFIPGRVRYSGKTVEIDLSDIESETSGMLVFKLINSDSDTGTQIEVKNLTNSVDPEGSALPSFPVQLSSVPIGPAIDTSSLNPSSELEANFSAVRFDSATGEYKALLQVRNSGSPVGRNVAVSFPNLPADVQLQNPSGTNPAGSPYINLRNAIPAGGLQSQASSAPVEIAFSNPNFVRFPLTTTVLSSAANSAPNFDPVAPLNVKIGERLSIPLSATDSDGDRITYSLSSDSPLPTSKLEGNGTLIFTPAPGEEGTYTFTLTASDGAAIATQTATLTVVAEPRTIPRIFGVIQNTDQQPLANVLVLLGESVAITEADGSFKIPLIEAPGTELPNTLKIYGDGITGEDSYPYIAEKLPLLLEHEVYAGFDNVISRPIYLPPIDFTNAQIIDPAADTTVTTAAIPKASVFVKAGSLKDTEGNLYTENLSITEVPTELTPAALPPNLHTDLVVTIQPGDMVFTTPAPLSLPNRAGYAPDTTMDLWSINPTTGFFDNVGTGKVTADGTTIETISGGIRNSSWHFFAPPAPSLRDPSQNPRNPKDNCNECKANSNFTSTVELHSGAVIETHNLVSYQSMGENRSLTLTYDSLRADPRPILNFSYDNITYNPQRRLVAELSLNRGNLQYQIPGFKGGEYGLNGGEHIWSIPEAGGTIDAALQADMSSLPSGQYDYTLTTGIRQFTGTIFAGSSSDNTGKLLNVNTINSPFGSGWGIAGWQELVENPDKSVLLIDGDGGELVFDAPTTPGGTYLSPPGDFSTLEKQSDGTFRRTLKDQTTYNFNATNQLASIKEPNGNETKYSYNTDGKIERIVDPSGLLTTFTYTNGKVSEIVDPAGRSTQLEYDTAGNLQKIIDPDTKARTFSYDAQRHMIGEIDKRGFSEQTSYDFAGRAKTAIKKDGSTIQVAPVQVQGLYPSEQTTNPLNPPVAKVLGAVETTTADSNGNVETEILDQTGQVVSAKDGGGLKPAFERNQNLLVTKRTDARGNVTDYEYDGKGNVKSISDSLSGTEETPPNNNGQLFSAKTYYPVGSSPTLGTIKDINDDGNLDIVTANRFTNNVSVIPGNGDGTFAPKKDYAVANGPRSVGLGDVNGDGKNDIVTASISGGTNPPSGRVSVLLGDGNGNFAAQTNYAVGSGAVSVAIGDINKDGRNDIVTANSSSNNISVLLGNSSGSFSRTDIPLNSAPEAVILNDLDKDGNLDIISATPYGPNSTGRVSVLLGNGNGTFASQSNYTVASQARSVAVGDINKDGKNDIVTAGSGSGNVAVASVLLGSNGSFTPATNYSLNSYLSSTSVAIGDLDLD
ncbi:FG-GAP-like repeat-containing protein, partial [Kamptonema sp. PCC 6506]|uniref:FG-GAP-like repeat-containing protein n=3 Tax=Kamptonema TaxID=1501433 RepID=UPI00187220D5